MSQLANETGKLLAAEGSGGSGIRSRPSTLTLLSTGSTLLNLACTGSPHGGFEQGKYYFLVGDSASGKTFLAITCLAEATMSKRFKNYRLIYDNGEDGMLLDLEHLFNKAVARRIESPAMDDGTPVHSDTIEEFYYHLDDAAKKGTPFIYILDSMDALDEPTSDDKFTDRKKAYRGGKAVKGSYALSKAKWNSTRLRSAVRALRPTGSILIILSQTRDNLGFGFEKKTRSGGHALKFYATIEIWSSLVGQIKRTVRGKPRSIGVKVKLRIRKNRATGQIPEIIIPIYPSFGIDDLGSCVEYLIDEGWWKVKGKRKLVYATGLGVELPREKLIAYIEQEELTRKLRRIVADCWRDIEKRCALKRKGRYGE